jgi:hypothetical protein
MKGKGNQEIYIQKIGWNDKVWIILISCRVGEIVPYQMKKFIVKMYLFTLKFLSILLSFWVY